MKEIRVEKISELQNRESFLSAKEKHTIYFSNLDLNDDQLSILFGTDYKFGLEVKNNQIVLDDLDSGIKIQIENGTLQQLNKGLEEGFKLMSYDLKNKERYIEECNSIFQTGESQNFINDGKDSAFVLATDFELEGVVKKLIAWLWISQDIERSQRTSIKSAIKKYLKDLEQDCIASVHNKNKASIKYLENMNFKRMCIIC